VKVRRPRCRFPLYALRRGARSIPFVTTGCARLDPMPSDALPPRDYEDDVSPAFLGVMHLLFSRRPDSGVPRPDTPVFFGPRRRRLFFREAPSCLLSDESFSFPGRLFLFPSGFPHEVALPVSPPPFFLVPAPDHAPFEEFPFSTAISLGVLGDDLPYPRDLTPP